MTANARARFVPRLASAFAFVLASSVGLAAQRAAAASCPDNQIILPGAIVTTSRASLDTTATSSLGGYDLRAGRVSIEMTIDNSRFGGLVVTDDVYRIVGLPTGTPVDFAASFTVSGFWNVFPGVPQGEFSCDGSIAADADSAGFFIPGGCCHNSISQPLAISLHRTAQTLFHVRLRLGASQYRGHVSQTGQLAFSGLPANVAVVSCQGFTSNPAVPVVHKSWGELKAHYR